MSCSLLDGSLALFLQFMVGVMAYAILVYKRSIEKPPRRSFSIWFMDISKQGFSSLLIHAWNVFSARLFAHFDTSNNEGDECAFYVINYVLDTCIGIFLIWSFLLAASRAARNNGIPSIEMQGYYGDPALSSWYLAQLLVFCSAVILSKIILSCVELVWASELRWLSSWLFAQFFLSDDLELVLSLIILPFFLSMIQYWIQDNILMDQLLVSRCPYQEIEASPV